MGYKYRDTSIWMSGFLLGAFLTACTQVHAEVTFTGYWSHGTMVLWRGIIDHISQGWRPQFLGMVKLEGLPKKSSS